MNKHQKLIITYIYSVMLFFALTNKVYSQTEGLPNILWLVSEDNSPMAGAYGDDFATTPNMDKLAAEGFLYTNAHANAPVCAPARNTIITGVHANSNGNQHMRSFYKVSDIIQFFPQILKEAGYYTTNNAKEDYNIASEQTENIWHESSNEAHYKNREKDQSFFAVFNNHQSHEGTIHNLKPYEDLRHDPEKVTLPPYHPDTPEIRQDWAQFYDNIEDMDIWLGRMLQELEDSGESDNTIVFYYGDHGGVLPRSKRFFYETGTRVPFIVRIPEKFKELWPAEEPGSEVDRPISFVDLAPTLLSIIGEPIPDFMQGEPFLGTFKTPDPDYVYMFRDRMDERYDMSRAVRGNQYRYIRNYMPYRKYGQHIEYLWRAASMRSWEEICQNGECNPIQNKFWEPKPVEELYDTENDPWEINNLAEDPEYFQTVVSMRQAMQQWMVKIKDTGFIPEAELLKRLDRSGESSIYDFIRSGKVPIEDIIIAANKATLATENDIELLKSYLKFDDSAIRYWGATGLLLLGNQAYSAIPDLIAALDDPSPNVVVVASEALYNLNEIDAARSGFKKLLLAPSHAARNHVLNAIDSVNDQSIEIKHAVINMAKQQRVLSNQHYDHRAVMGLLDKWEINKSEYDIKVDF